MASILTFIRRAAPAAPATDTAALARMMQDCSIEVMPRTAAKIDDFRALLPAGTRVYVAHIDGTPFADVLATARRLTGEGFAAVPHVAARGIADAAELEARLAALAEAGVSRALVIAGGIDTPRGCFTDSLQLLRTGLFDRYGFTDLFVAGHPEGSRDIDPDGSDRAVMEAARWKSAFAERTDARMAMTTQFCFDAGPVIAWVNRLKAEGVNLPVHIGVAGPAKLQTLIKFAISCGVGPSLKVLQKRAMDVTKLLLPYEPTDFLTELAAHKAAHPDFGIEQVHFFPLGGIKTNAQWVTDNGGAAGVPASKQQG